MYVTRTTNVKRAIKNYLQMKLTNFLQQKVTYLVKPMFTDFNTIAFCRYSTIKVGKNVKMFDLGRQCNKRSKFANQTYLTS